MDPLAHRSPAPAPSAVASSQSMQRPSASKRRSHMALCHVAQAQRSSLPRDTMVGMLRAAIPPLLLLVLSFFVAADSQLTAAAQAPYLQPSQHVVLRQLVTQWGPFNGSATWVSSTTPKRCNTYAGISCDAKGNIVSMILPEVNIRGPVGVLSRLTTLSHLDLSANFIEGSLVGLSTLKGLVYLNLNATSVSDVPLQLSTLVNLQHLDLSYNAIQGPIPPVIPRFARLTELILSGNTLNGTLSAGLGNLIDLVILKISATGSAEDGECIRGPIPQSFSRLVKLKHLKLNRNALNGSVPAFIGSFNDLTYLRLSDNSFRGPLPDALSKLSNLAYLGLRYNGFSGNIPNGFGQLAKLSYLSMFGNTFEGPIPNSFSNLTNLDTLLLHYNFLSGGIPPIQYLSKLSYLNLEYNYLSGQLPVIPYSLVSLDIALNYFTGSPSLRYPNGSLACLSGAYNFGGNCFTSKPKDYKCGFYEAQKSSSQCAAFCGTGRPAGTCNGKGVCTPKRSVVKGALKITYVCKSK